MLSEIRSAVLLASTDSALIAHLQQILNGLGLQVQVAMDGEQAMAALASMADPALRPASVHGSAPSLVLLDVRLPGVAQGRLLAAMHESDVRRRCAIALIAERVSDEWIARLREGVIDDIVPRDAGENAWKTHVSTMQRGHALYCELEYLREVTQLEVRHDAVTGSLNRETLLTILFRETDRVQRLHGMLSVVVFDLDDFSRWNGELGRDVGDQLLREVARRTGRILRTYDALGRVGRDEFLLALPGCSAINAAMLAERLRMEVFGEPFWVKKADRAIVEVRLTACFGITVSRGRSPVVVVREAEQVMRHARQMGPATIRCASDIPQAAETAVAQLFSEAETLVR